MPGKFSGQLNLFDNISTSGLWEVAISISFAVNSVKDRTAVFDSRSALILAPEADILLLTEGIEQAYYDGATGLVVPCKVSSVQIRKANAVLTFAFSHLLVSALHLAVYPFCWSRQIWFTQ